MEDVAWAICGGRGEMTAGRRAVDNQGRVGPAAAVEPHVSNPPHNGIYVLVSLDNHLHLAAAYNPEFASFVLQNIYERARKYCKDLGGTVRLDGDRLVLAFDARVMLPGSAAGHLLLDRVLSVLGNAPVSMSGVEVFAAISASLEGFEKPPSDRGGITVAAAFPGSDALWRARYVEDMAVAWSVFAALEAGHLYLRHEPICDAHDTRDILYYELLLRKVVAGQTQTAGAFIPALERLGLIRRVDQWVADSAIHLLREDPAVRLGFNISGLSAVIDGWWTSIVATLAVEPELARRLTIEITETAPLSNMACARHFIATMRALGCHIALDDVGAGFSSIEMLADLSPDIVKLDGAYIRRARGDARARGFLANLIGLAASSALSVVVEGIETEEDHQAALLSGATWVQGYRFSASEPYVGKETAA